MSGERRNFLQTTLEYLEGLRKSENRPDEVTVTKQDQSTDIITEHRGEEETHLKISEKPDVPSSSEPS